MKKILILLLFFITNYLLFITHCEGQWIQQTLPHTGTIYDLEFVNQNTGFVSLYNSTTGYFMKTTNSGFNWNVMNNYYVFGIQFLDSINGYSHGRSYGSYDILFKTTDCGNNWDSLQISLGNSYRYISFINKDTGWISGHNGSLGTIWKTTNGGLTLIPQLNSGTSGMDVIYMLKEKVNGEYWGWCSQGSYLRRTTNSGLNWNQIATLPKPTVTKMYFINQDTGWFNENGSGGGLFRTTNGGINWYQQTMPNLPQLIIREVDDFCFVDNNYGWGVGGSVWFGGSRYFGVIWATTNGGVNWGYQLPDTNMVYVNGYSNVFFYDRYCGWAETGGPGIHTTVGGGPIIYTKINNNNTNISKDFVLYQNYPNPFNSVSSIKYQVSSKAEIRIILYDIIGKEVAILMNEKKSPGIYEVRFEGGNLSSGIYFYSLIVDGIRIETKKMVLNK